jgi:hypothetical protein
MVRTISVYFLNLLLGLVQWNFVLLVTQWAPCTLTTTVHTVRTAKTTGTVKKPNTYGENMVKIFDV